MNNRKNTGVRSTATYIDKTIRDNENYYQIKIALNEEEFNTIIRGWDETKPLSSYVRDFLMAKLS